jgi:2,4-dienoyl-CoA reductase-like NADH-dependent reductase (Old Yellow Enzyme family)
MLFTPAKIGTLKLKNRIVRSATQESLADEKGFMNERIYEMYRDLVKGGVGLIITGHMCVHPGGRANPQMSGIYNDEHIPGMKKLVDVVHAEGGRVCVQINHAGMYADRETGLDLISASDTDPEIFEREAREMTIAEVETMVAAFGLAARRAVEAGFDAVQIHAAHGYLTSQFHSPLINKRTDKYGGDINSRMTFLKEVAAAVRKQVGPDYPVLIKLGMMDGDDGGLTLDEGVEIVKALHEMSIDGVELSGSVGGKKISSVSKGIQNEGKEAYFMPFAKAAKPATNLPIILVGGFRSKSVMEAALAGGNVDFVSICRPLINDPYLPNKMQSGELEKSGCLSANNCWAESPGAGISCKCPTIEKKKSN